MTEPTEAREEAQEEVNPATLQSMMLAYERLVAETDDLFTLVLTTDAPLEQRKAILRNACDALTHFTMQIDRLCATSPAVNAYVIEWTRCRALWQQTNVATLQ